MRTEPSSCPFCEIVRHDDPDAREIYRDEDVVAFFPLEPATLGHTLVVPRTHIPDIWSVSEALAPALAIACGRLARVIRSELSPEGLNVIQSNGAAATQTVNHLHIHLVPRWADDKVGRIWPPETNFSDSEKDEAWQRLRMACRTQLME